MVRLIRNLYAINDDKRPSAKLFNVPVQNSRWPHSANSQLTAITPGRICSNFLTLCRNTIGPPQHTHTQKSCKLSAPCWNNYCCQKIRTLNDTQWPEIAKKKQ
jgi:hypothetical protein